MRPAASGIGLAVVNRFIEMGWNVALLDLNSDAGSAIAARLGKQALFIKANVAIYKEQVDAFYQVWNKWGRVDFGELIL
jgi:NAD(P)-dependent dehydrogenase (short-subunit alcohol dehydrogenase family)